MKVDNELVDKLAELARLEFDAKAKEEIKKDLANVIGFVEKLNELNLDGVEPLVYITEEKNALRKDEVKQTINKQEALSNVPLKDSDYIKVPKVLKK